MMEVMIQEKTMRSRVSEMSMNRDLEMLPKAIELEEEMVAMGWKQATIQHQTVVTTDIPGVMVMTYPILKMFFME